MRVKKRSNEIVDFNKYKIVNAIENASKSVDEYDKNFVDKLYNEVLSIIYLRHKIDDIVFVENIQDIVEEVLINNKCVKIAKSFILYREQRKRIRELTAMVNSDDLIEQYLDKSDWQIKENSNMAYSLQGLNNHISSTVSSNYWLNRVYTPKIKYAHKNGDIHIHDLQLLAPYCFTGDTKVKLLDGRDLSFYELVDEYSNGEKFWVFSRDNDTNEIIPALAHSPRMIEKNKELLEITLDNNEKIKCTPDHKFRLRDGKYLEAKNLKIGESLSPLYVYKSGKEYKKIAYEPGSEMYLHRYISWKYIGKQLKNKQIVHHKNGNKCDNRPENLEIMEDIEHRAFEIKKTMGGEKWKKSVNKMLIERNKSKKQKEIVSEYAKKRNRDDKGKFINHKVIGIKKLEYKEDVYCLTVDKYHNFALSAGVFVHNCAGWDLKDLFINGFGGVDAKIESKPPKHFRTALGQIVNFFYTLQGEIAGAQAFSSFDTYLAPFVREDQLSQEDVKQAIQEFVFNVNIPTRVGFQTPFTNITMDVVPPKIMCEDSVIIGGKLRSEKYRDFQKEMDMINIAFAEVMMEGDSKGRVFTFPIPTYNITNDINWDSPVLEKVFEMTAKYGIPYFSNFINSDMSPDDARSMCCRLRLDNRELRKRGGGLFGANPLTGSIGVVTINLPRIGYLSKNKEEFFSRLEKLMELSKNSLETKRKVLEKLTNDGLYPYAKYYLKELKNRFGEYWNNHFSTIGLIGMIEALLNFRPIGVDITTEVGKEFALEVMDFMREKIMDYQNETNHLYNLEATPAEGTTRRLANIDKSKYNDIITGNNDGVCYYTNSTHLPVGYTDDIFKALDLQDDIQIKYTGGTVFHTYLGEAMPSSESVKKLIQKISSNYKLPYFTITPTFSICIKHGYISGEHQRCPQCDNICEIYSRVNGYLRPVAQWNDAKQSEFADRKVYKNATKK